VASSARDLAHHRAGRRLLTTSVGFRRHHLGYLGGGSIAGCSASSISCSPSRNCRSIWP
jgi:hypothetical protein